MTVRGYVPVPTGGVEDGDTGVCKREGLVETSAKEFSCEPHLAPDDFDGRKVDTLSFLSLGSYAPRKSS